MQLVKPTEEICSLLSVLLPHTTPLFAMPNQRFHFHRDGRMLCYLIDGGCLAVHRSDSSVISTVSGPFILGLSHLHLPSDTCYLRTHEAMNISVMPVDEVLEKLNEYGMWRELSHLLMFISGQYLRRDVRTATSSSYEKIRTAMIDLDNEPEAIRKKTTTASYIQERTHLSRSHIMKIIRELKKGGYIATSRGILLSISQLPVKF
ncbi:helix-turn-helix domain-containing protein [Enterobacter sp. 22452]|uniref:helix-turn-helix domain-containing protein n=1 Tax=Enterobacter TaxID=547 RepID=UPI003F85DC5C